MTVSRTQTPFQVSRPPKKSRMGGSSAKAIKQSQGRKNGGMVRYKNGGCVMAGRGVRDTKMG
jgi:hypothetical protein